ncbi:YARHG domain-containing protein [Vitiosangium sp. GDMCC 1.1324]|uniref:YARHG domain-containing protein n=1 Tax=Vitiosangium sp. (strain GDMCC 1.1324) TaxID=2138576 RepID=UPI00130E9FE2|nr:YARHG domain-containing protein [Vitiosangium sp. GDMCC 1.1324]
MLPLLLSLLLAQNTRAADTAALCTHRWPDQTSPFARDTTTCREWWLTVAYEGLVTEDSLTMDPPATQPQGEQVSTARLKRAAEHVRKACGQKCTDRDNRAIEYFENEIRFRLNLIDPRLLEDISPLMEKVLAGQPLRGKAAGPSFLDNLGPLSYRKLRNGVFARHGRVFKDPDLNELFYGSPRPEDWTRAHLPTLKQNPQYTDALLTSEDKANLATLQALEKRKRD